MVIDQAPGGQAIKALQHVPAALELLPQGGEIGATEFRLYLAESMSASTYLSP